jgi:hypothetical protein
LGARAPLATPRARAMARVAVAAAARRLARGPVILSSARELPAALPAGRAPPTAAAASAPCARRGGVARDFATASGSSSSLPCCPTCSAPLSPHFPQGLIGAAVRAGTAAACAAGARQRQPLGRGRRAPRCVRATPLLTRAQATAADAAAVLRREARRARAVLQQLQGAARAQSPARRALPEKRSRDAALSRRSCNN